LTVRCMVQWRRRIAPCSTNLFPCERWCRPARGFTPVAERGELAVERIGDRSRDHLNARRSAQILMHDEPGRAQRRWFVRPDAHHIGFAVA
jgi:hypothetical protein